jgi:hypothetical protein
MTKSSFKKQVLNFHKEIKKLGLIPTDLWIDKREKNWVAKFFIRFNSMEFKTKDVHLRSFSRIYASITIRGEKALEYYGDIFLPVVKRIHNPLVADLLKELTSYKPVIEDFDPYNFRSRLDDGIYSKNSRLHESYITDSITHNMYFSVIEASYYAEALYMGDIAKSAGYLLKFKEYNSKIDKEIKQLEGVRPSNDHIEARRTVDGMMDNLVDFRCRLKLCLELNPVFSEELHNVKLELAKYLKKGRDALSEFGIEFPDALNFNVTSEFESASLWYNSLLKESNTACDLVSAMKEVLKYFHDYAYPISELSFFNSMASLRILHSCIDKVNSISKHLKPKPKSFDNEKLKSSISFFEIDADIFRERSTRKDLAGIVLLVTKTLNSAKSALNKKGYRFTIKIQYGETK